MREASEGALCSEGTTTGFRSLLKYAGKGEGKVALVFGARPDACHRAVLHLLRGAPEVPVWLFTTTQPDRETHQTCELVCVRPGGLRLLLEAQRRAWPRWVAISVGPWTGERGEWMLKAAPFLIPPGRALLQNENGDFFAGKPGPILRHLARRVRDQASSAWNRARDLAHRAGDGVRDEWNYARRLAHQAGDRVRYGAHLFKLLLLMAAGTALRWLGYPHCRWFGKLHGTERLDVVLSPAAGPASGCATLIHAGPQWDGEALRRLAEGTEAPWILWGQGGEIKYMLPLFDDPRTFAVSRQRYFRGWKPMPVPMAPFRRLQAGEASRVLAPVSDTILVDRAKLLALGIPEASLAGTAWLLLFWKAAAAGWRSYSIGQEGGLKAQPDFPMQETAFVLKVAVNAGLRRLGPREPELARGAVSCSVQSVRCTVAAPEPAKPRVLVVSPFLPYPLAHGGAVRIWNLCGALSDRVDFVLAAVRESHDHVDYGKLGEVFRQLHVVDIDERAAQDNRLPAQVRHHQSAPLRALIAEIAREWQPDVLQIEYSHMAHFRDAAPEVPAILVEHDLTYSLYRQLAETRRDAESRAEYRRWLAFERGWLERYDAVWTVSEEDRGRAIEECGSKAERTFSIPNGVDTCRFAPSDDAGGPEIFYVGSFRHLPNLLGFEKLEREVMPRVWGRLPEARLRVVAGPRYEQFWKRRALDPRIAMHGFVEDLRPLYRSASVVVIPLEVSAGTNIKVLEAMACGKPVVTTAVGGAGLQLQDGYDALIRDHWDGFAAAVCDLLTDRPLRDGIGAHARFTAEDRFSWRAIAARAYESYCALRVATATCSGSV